MVDRALPAALARPVSAVAAIVAIAKDGQPAAQTVTRTEIAALAVLDTPSRATNASLQISALLSIQKNTTDVWGGESVSSEITCATPKMIVAIWKMRGTAGSTLEILVKGLFLPRPL
jgi:hypothetical protein